VSRPITPQPRGRPNWKTPSNKCQRAQNGPLLLPYGIHTIWKTCPEIHPLCVAGALRTGQARGLLGALVNRTAAPAGAVRTTNTKCFLTDPQRPAANCTRPSNNRGNSLESHPITARGSPMSWPSARALRRPGWLRRSPGDVRTRHTKIVLTDPGRPIVNATRRSSNLGNPAGSHLIMSCRRPASWPRAWPRRSPGWSRRSPRGVRN